MNADPLDLVILLAVGLLGFTMRRFGWPVAPAVIGLILGPVAETNLRRALASNGDLTTLVDSWFSRVVFLVALLAIAGPPILRVVLRRRKVSVPTSS